MRHRVIISFLISVALIPWSLGHAAHINERLEVEQNAKTPLVNMGIEQTLSDQAQRMTIAFDGLAYLTGGLCSDSFLPPGKIADFFGFQYFRDNDPDMMGHNTDYLTRIANNILFILTEDQIGQMVDLAGEQVELINQYAYMRFPLMDAFRRLLLGDLPAGSGGLNKDAVLAYSAALYRLDGRISYQRAELLGRIIRSLDQQQIDYLNDLASTGMLSWPDVGDQLDPNDYSHDVHVAVMTYAGQLFSWYAGDTVSDVYFCPERQGTYFGSFYLKDIPAMGNPGYTIDPNKTANMGQSFLDTINSGQADSVSGLVDVQREDLYEIVEVRQAISETLRRFITEGVSDEELVLSLAEKYGQLDGAISYDYATVFAEVGQSLSDEQIDELMILRDLDDFPCTGAYLYSENIAMPEIANTDFLFNGSNDVGEGDAESSGCFIQNTAFYLH